MMRDLDPNVESRRLLQEAMDAEREIARLKEIGAVDFSEEPEPEVITQDDPLRKLGIVNRGSARRAGLLTRRMKNRRMAVPK